ncbi:helix-turn-helix transcriptional regulator [Enterobacter asburiae]|uniref:helix-turn-helix domain-containing protein n=1 Tax=Enterobacter asburiae TaxID=61645 RepID=UPI002879D1A1|nr:helix-turn-helix transcriptional regulator [Enterobacter asburiae]MDS1916287.1 helix-turn-helix transcriptional regulator [Enterobacter asburiae]
MIAGSKSQVKMMVPKRLRAARHRAGLSQEKFLQLTNVEAVSDKSQISNYESGRHSPPFEFVVQIAKALNYPEAYFYTVDDDFSEQILLIHRNKNNPDFNPYFKPLKEALDAVNALKKMLDKATGTK